MRVVHTAIQAAAHTGQRAIAEYLLAKGARLEVCTAAMLGDVAEVEVAAPPEALYRAPLRKR